VGDLPAPTMHLPAVPLLLALLCAPEPDALALFRQWRRSPSPELRLQAVRTLHGVRGPEARAALLSLLADPQPAVRAAVRRELVALPPDDGPALAQGIAALRDPRAREEGVRAVLARKEDVTPFAVDPAPAVRARALASGRVALPQARAALRQRDPLTRALALECTRDPGEARALLRDPAPEVRIACARVTDDPEAVAALLGDRSWRVQLAAILAAERLRQAALVPPLIRVVRGPPGRVRARAAAALESLTRAPFGEDARRWEAWWAGTGAGYALPPPRAAPRRVEHTASRVTFRHIPVDSLRCCFVLDASRSMEKEAPGAQGKTRWELVVRDLGQVLDRLPQGARFNVILFRTEVAAWRRRLVPATPAARRACLAWIGEEKPAGWTNLFDALDAALGDDDVDALYLLTDGVPSRGAETRREDILDEIAYRNRYRLVQVNCVQAGGAEGLGKRWEGFLEDLAHAHDGHAVRE